MAKSKQILLKRSSVKGKIPALSAMTHGEVFLNYNDGVLLSKSSSNAVLKWSDDSKMATKNELNLKLDKIEAEGSYVKNADFQFLVSEIEDNERVITTAFEKFRESAGFNENGESTLGKSLTEAISELDGAKALANKVTVSGDIVKITTLSANTFSANTVKVGSLSANTISANTVKVRTVSANTISANTIKSNLIGIADSAKTSYSAVTSTSAKTSVSAITSFSAATAKSADSAKKLSTGRTITLSGDVNGSVSFDGSSNVTLNTTISQTKKYTSLNGVPSGSDGWYSLMKLTDSLNSPAMFLIKTYPHTSVIFTVGKGYNNRGNITVLQTCKQGNASYYHMIGVRLIEDGTVQIKLNKGTSDVINISVMTLNTGDSKLFNTLSIDTASQSVIHEVELADATISSTNISANTLSAATIRTTNLSATTVSAHTIKSLTMSANTISGNTVRATAMSSNTISANTIKAATISASTIKSTTTDGLRKDIDILSGDTYILDIVADDNEAGSVISKTISSDEINKIESAKDIIVNIITNNDEQRQTLKTTYFVKEGNYINILASTTMPVNYSGDDNNVYNYTTTIGFSITIKKESNILTAQVGYVTNYDYSSIINDISNSFLTINLGNYESYSDENGNYIIVDFDFEDKLSNCVGAKVIIPDQIEAHLTSKTTHRPTNGEPYHVYEFSCLRINRDNDKSDYLYGDIVKLTTSSTNKIYVDWEGRINIGSHALDSDSAITSYSAITAISAITSYSATTATKWSTGRKITLGGDATGNVTLDGSQNVTLNVNVLSADTVPASGVKGVLLSDNMPTTINKTIRYTSKQHFDGDIHVCGNGEYGGAVYFGDYDGYHDEDHTESRVYIKEKSDDILDIIGFRGVRIGNLSDNSDGSESYKENYAIIVDENGSVTINDLVGYATSDEVDENNEILTKALNRLNTSAGFNSLGESTLPSGMTLTKAILELQKGGGVADTVNVTESSSKSYIVTRETTDSDETSLHYDDAIWSENGQLYASSDKNLKEHIGNVDGNPELIKSIPKVFYHWKDDEQKRIQMGTYAQDIEKVYPEVVSRDDNGNLAVSYDRLSVIALAGIDELYKMIQDLKEENKQLRNELNSLKK